MAKAAEGNGRFSLFVARFGKSPTNDFGTPDLAISTLVAGEQIVLAAIRSSPTATLSSSRIGRRAGATGCGGVPTDPLYTDQWHLFNSGQTGGTSGEDANVVPVWNAGWTGLGVVIGVLDDGLQWDHPDLSPNYLAGASYDYNDIDTDPYPGHPGDGHGTSAAGVAAASDDGSTCGVGAAYNAQLAGLRILGADIDDAGEANALNHQTNVIDIYSNSWGPSDSSFNLEGPGPLAQQALEQGILQGRNGLGNIYVWATGNGLDANQNVNYDGYAKHPGRKAK